MTTKRQFDEVTTWLAGCRRPMLLSHRRPDGDALGALAGLSRALQKRGHEPVVVLFDPFPPRYALIQDAATWHPWADNHSRLMSQSDGLIIVDTCAVAQLGPAADFLSAVPRTLVLDHHATRDPIATRPGDLRLFDESASATCLMIAEWVAAAGIALDPALATALFVGIGTDCGWFRFSNTDARTLGVAADLVSAGARPNEIHAAIYERDAEEKLRLIGRMLQSLKLHAGGKLAVMTVRQRDFTETGADRSATEDMVNEAGRLGGTEATILFTEEPDQVRVNFRSKRRLDVAALAAQFGGGGHTRAAGARLHGDWDEIVRRVVTAATTALTQT